MKNTFMALVATAAMWPAGVEASIEVDGKEIHVVDAHVHAGHIGAFNLAGKAAIASSFPAIVSFYHIPVMAAASDPFSPFIGLKAERDRAGVDRAVLLAAYTHRTAGYLTNQQLANYLYDPRNGASPEEPWAYGLVSINLDDFSDPAVASQRLQALRSYFQASPERFIGIKLAHAHQRIALNDEGYYAVYDVAAEYSVPVLMHTGVPGAWGGQPAEPVHYDPHYLRAAIELYNGNGHKPRVDFVLSHVGIRDLRAAQHAVDLARDHDNVWLELSALGGSAAIDAAGAPIEDPTPFHAYVLPMIKEAGVVGKSIYGSDDNKPGAAKEYLLEMVQAMKIHGYSTEEIEGVLGLNFYRCFKAASVLSQTRR